MRFYLDDIFLVCLTRVRFGEVDVTKTSEAAVVLFEAKTAVPKVGFDDVDWSMLKSDTFNGWVT